METITQTAFKILLQCLVPFLIISPVVASIYKYISSGHDDIVFNLLFAG